MKQSSKQNNHIAANLLVRSVNSIFPRAKILDVGETKKGFFCKCVFSHDFDDQALNMVQEELQRSIQEGLIVESVEMMRENTANLFQHRNQEYLAENILEHPSNIVELIRIGDFYGVCPAPHPIDTKELGFVKLFKVIDDDCIRIEGVIKNDKKTLKKYLKQITAFSDHSRIGADSALFEVDQSRCLWAPKGEVLKSVLIEQWKHCHMKMGCGLIGCTGDIEDLVPPFRYGNKLAHIFEKQRNEPFSLEGGLFDLTDETVDLTWWALDEKSAQSEVNSYLQFIKKTINMIPIDCKWIFYTNKCKTKRNQNKWDLSVNILKEALEFCGIEPVFEDSFLVEQPKIEVEYIDILGRMWRGPKIELHDSQVYQLDQSVYAFVMVGSLFRSLEMMIAILLEATNGKLPVWLAPEQVRVLPVKEIDVAQANQLTLILQTKGYRVDCDTTSKPLSEKVYAARMCSVPYMLILGRNERENGTIAVKSYSDDNGSRVITFDVFMEVLHKHCSETQYPYFE